MFDKVLIANRGEIACRIARTCRELGIRTVGVYSEADADALHVDACDEAWLLGPAPAEQSYLNVERLLDVVRRSGAEAVHPGYGFLSENADFAQVCEDAGVVFIGPPVEAIRAMGSKSAAKTIMEEAGVPLVPGYHGDNQDDDHLAHLAADIGYPVLIKASAGGGGKGMRRVDGEDEFADALAAARRESRSAFGDDHVLVEKCLVRPRHVEVQVFADTLGNTVHLFERDCSVQRRHQKILEEAPAPNLSAAQRERMGTAAVAAARAIGYVGAGTVEFIMHQDGSFYFMEMNTRLQVEHPVTEMVTGQDLVAWQLRVAAGEPLPLEQDELDLNGHAFEARIYAEDPSREFLPATGIIRHLRTPHENGHVRLDSGVREGDAVSIHYDPMIAKLIVRDRNREDALRRLRRALENFTVAGVTTNTRFLAALAGHPAFAAGDVHTSFIQDHAADLLPPPEAVPDRFLAVAALFELLSVERAAAVAAQRANDPWSPWHGTDGWQLNSDNFHTLHFMDGALDREVVAHYRPDGFLLELPGGEVHVNGRLDADGAMRVELDGVLMNARTLRDGERLTVVLGPDSRELLVHDPLTAGMEDELREGTLTAPMPGTVLDVMVQPLQRVEEGAPLMVLEAMKMEHTIRAAVTGTVDHVNYAVGDQVPEGAELLAISPEE